MNQLIPLNVIKCPVQDHDEAHIQFFKFSQKKEEILQCLYCNLEDKEPQKKVILEQLMRDPVWKIKNFPPLENQEKSKLVRLAIENNQKEKIKIFQDNVFQQIEKIFQDISDSLLKELTKQKKQVILQFEDIFKLQNQNQLDFYDLEELKMSIKSFSNAEINLEQLFQIQLQKKKEYSCEKKAEVIIDQGKFQQQIQQNLENLNLQMKNKLQIFSENIKINFNDEEIAMIQDRQLQKGNFNQQLVQQQDNQLNKNIQNILIQNQDLDKKMFIRFHKSQYNNDKYDQEEIQILDGKANNQIIKFNDQNIKVFKQVYSDILDKNQTYHIRMKTNFFGKNNNQNLKFCLLESKQRDKFYHLYNYIQVCFPDGKCCASNGIDSIVEGEQFTKFLKDDESILNIVINYEQSCFEVYDDERKGYIKNVIDKQKIQGDMVFGILVWQFASYKAVFDVIEIK